MNSEEFDKAIKILQPYTKQNSYYSISQLILTIVMLYVGILLSYYSILNSSFWILVISMPITIAFMCRSYVIEHDCGHQSYFRSANLNDITGNVFGFGIMIPYSMWKFIHNSHHMHVGNLDKRDFNPEVWTMTITEFQNAPKIKRTFYRFMRSRFSRLIIVPSINYGLACRLIHPNFNKKAIFR